MLYNIYYVSGFTADLHTASPQLRPTLLNAFTMKIWLLFLKPSQIINYNVKEKKKILQATLLSEPNKVNITYWQLYVKSFFFFLCIFVVHLAHFDCITSLFESSPEWLECRLKCYSFHWRSFLFVINTLDLQLSGWFHLIKCINIYIFILSFTYVFFFHQYISSKFIE